MLALELLLLDESTASLDPDTADWSRQHLQIHRRRSGATILLASHDMPEVDRLCDRVIIMKRGRIEDDDSPGNIMLRYDRATLEEVFLDIARGRDSAAHGPGAESIVRTLMFVLMPLACIYHSVTVLPHWLRYVAWTLPPTYVFEGMRSLLVDHEFRADLMIAALAINAVLLVASFAGFLALLRSPRQNGSLIRSGE